MGRVAASRPGDGVLIDVVAMAWRAASLISSARRNRENPGKINGVVLQRSRVISRMTDSVNCSALAESMRRAMWVMLVSEVDME